MRFTLLTGERGPALSLLAQREDDPRGSLGSRDMSLAVKEKKVKEKLDQRIPGGRKRRRKGCLELDRSVLLSGSSSAGSSSDSSASAGNSPPRAVAARTRRERLQRWRRRGALNVGTYSEAHAGERAKVRPQQ
ncbi:hypothetical protein GWK47_029754 [Chionoecetes opilio]|uniref:Uncharacterized protein n=1 Tax=Chionoecetes opilio TaxID=41210 RepID=A0A8J4YK75_CHIOP|nr:hypothetical protein GWK47_029754 [Chionoecetes opilio]